MLISLLLLGLVVWWFIDEMVTAPMYKEDPKTGRVIEFVPSPYSGVFDWLWKKLLKRK